MFRFRVCLVFVQFGFLQDAHAARDPSQTELHQSNLQLKQITVSCPNPQAGKGMLTSRITGGKPAYLSFPKPCQPDGLVTMGSNGLPSLEGSWKGVCYTDKTQKLLGVDMQGFPQGSEQDMQAKTLMGLNVPTCKTKPSQSKRTTHVADNDALGNFDDNGDDHLDTSEAIEYHHSMKVELLLQDGSVVAEERRIEFRQVSAMHLLAFPWEYQNRIHQAVLKSDMDGDSMVDRGEEFATFVGMASSL